MKNLLLIGSPMGVGKSTVAAILKHRLDRCVMLDGDWCWDMDPFCVTDETKKMVMDNICFLLQRFIDCSLYENIVFCWVMHEQSIIDEICGRLVLTDCRAAAYSLVCSESALTARLDADVAAGKRSADVIARSLERLGHFAALATHRIDVSDISAFDAAERIIHDLKMEKRL